MKGIRFLIRSSLIGGQRLLRLEPGFISFESQKFREEPTRFPVAEIEAFRYGIHWIRGFQLVMGRIYFIDIRNSAKQMIRIRLRSFCRIGKRKLGEQYLQIVQSLMDIYFEDVVAHYTGLMDQGMEFELCGLPVTSDGLRLRPKKERVPWEHLRIHRNIFHFSLVDSRLPNDYKMLFYGSDWNAAIMLAVADYAVQKNKLSVKQN